MEKKLYAKVIEDNGGGLSLYVMDERDACIYAHYGYEYTHGQLSMDIATLIVDDSVAEWAGCEEEPTQAWRDLDIDGIGREIVASVTNGKLKLVPDIMGAAAKREFKIKD